MASSRKSSRSRSAPANLAARVAARLQGIVAPRDRVTLGLSGGVDSVVLLDCLKRVSGRLGFRLAALHVNHQLSPNAARWEAFCRRQCRARGIPFESVAVAVRRGDGPEAAARAARYAAFARQDCDYLALAHHCDDQVETLLLQLLRGAGVKGLAGMPLVRMQDRGSRIEGKAAIVRGRKRNPQSSIPTPAIVRPLLDTTREDILDYARRRRLKWIEDESNRDIRLRRNFLRHEVLPAIERRFPAYRATIARTAGHLAEAAAVLDEVAAADAAGWLEGDALAVEGLRRLPPARGRNLLRWFLSGHGVAMPGTERLGEALRQLTRAKGDARVAVRLDGAELRRYEGRAHVVRPLPAPARYRLRWQGEERLALPGAGGVLAFEHSAGRGISLARLKTGTVTIRPRRGGERLRPDCRRPARSLKKLLQEARIAPWLRERLPLVFHDDTLVWVAGIGVDCAYQAGQGERAVQPDWRPSA